MTCLGSEVLDSETDAKSGLIKFNAVLSDGDSSAASDHNLVFADFNIDNTLIQPSTGLKLDLDATDDNSYPEGGSSWSDISGRGNNATLVNTTFTNQTIETNESIGFNGVDSYAFIPASSTDLRITGTELTISVWIKFNDNGAKPYPSIISHRESFSSDESYGLIRNVATASGNYRFNLNTSNANLGHDFGVAPSFGNWENVVCVYDGSFMRSYINGVEVGVATAQTGNIIDKNVSTYIGAMNLNGSLYTDYYSEMDISKVMIYDSARSSSDILTDFNSIKSNFGL